MDEDRLVEIETRLAFQEDTLQQLNDVICRQQDQIDRLAARTEALRGQLGGVDLCFLQSLKKRGRSRVF